MRDYLGFLALIVLILVLGLFAQAQWGGEGTGKSPGPAREVEAAGQVEPVKELPPSANCALGLCAGAFALLAFGAVLSVVSKRKF